MEVHLTDLSRYFLDNIFLIITVHALLLVVTVGLILNIVRNWRREQGNKKQLAVRDGTYLGYVERDLKTLLILFIAYVLAVPFLFGFIRVSLY